MELMTLEEVAEYKKKLAAMDREELGKEFLVTQPNTEKFLLVAAERENRIKKIMTDPLRKTL